MAKKHSHKPEELMSEAEKDVLRMKKLQEHGPGVRQNQYGNFEPVDDPGEMPDISREYNTIGVDEQDWTNPNIKSKDKNSRIPLI